VGVKLADRLGGPELSDRELEVIRPMSLVKATTTLVKFCTSAKAPSSFTSTIF
jgi:hypothetical protein